MAREQRPREAIGHMSKRNRSKPPRSGPRPGGPHANRAPTPVAPPGVAAPADVTPSPLWLTSAAALCAGVFTALALATIPYGAPMPGWYFGVMGAAAGLTALALLAEPMQRWRAIVWWPVPVILGAWLLATMASGFPVEVAGRSWGMAFYALLFVGAQVAFWTVGGRRILSGAVLAVLIAIALDLWWQKVTGRSLIREVRADAMRWNGDVWVAPAPSGSFGNRNDQAVVGVLLPLSAGVLPSIWAWAFPAIALGAAGYVALIGASRQLLLGIGAAVGVTSLLRIPRRIRWWAAGAAVLLVAGAIAARPGVRARVLELAEAPLGDRGLPIVYGGALLAGHPVFGVGPSMYGHHYVLGVREGWTFAGQQLEPSGMPWVHCLPVEIACEFGMVGLVAYGAVLWGFVRRVRRALIMGGPARDMGIAVAASAASMAVMGLIDLTFIKDWVRICWWLVLGLGFAAPTLQGRQSAPPGATLPDSNGL